MDDRPGEECVLGGNECLGGGYEGTPPDEYYVLSWCGELVSFAAEQYITGDKEKGDVLTWKIHRLDIPSGLQARREEVMQLIREALDAQGLDYNRNRVVAINVQFNAFSNLNQRAKIKGATH